MASIDIPKSYLFQFPMGGISWKGMTVYQVVSRLRRVKHSNSNVKLFFLPNPVSKWYRREIVTSPDKSSCNSRHSQSLLSALEIPGGSWNTSQVSKAYLAKSLVGIVEPYAPNNQSERGNVCNKNTELCRSTKTTTDNVCFLPETNALRRCRSAGMISRKFNHNDRAYFTNNKQYLYSRNRTVAQNDYVYIRQGISSTDAGNANSLFNVYSPNGLSHCAKYKIAASVGNNTLSYIWVDGSANVVTFPDGEYDIYDFISQFNTLQIANGHYLIRNSNNVKTVLLNFNYNSANGTVLLNSLSYLDVMNAGSVIPQYALHDLWTPTQNVPQLILPIGNILGSKGLSFPPLNNGAGTTITSTSTKSQIVGSSGALLKPSFVPLYYKPSNPNFATQGGVSSSTRLARIKYNAIQKSANQMASAYGQAVANSLAYDVPVPDYSTNLKAKTGYRLTATPVVCKYKNKVVCKYKNKIL